MTVSMSKIRSPSFADRTGGNSAVCPISVGARVTVRALCLTPDSVVVFGVVLPLLLDSDVTGVGDCVTVAAGGDEGVTVGVVIVGFVSLPVDGAASTVVLALSTVGRTWLLAYGQYMRLPGAPAVNGHRCASVIGGLAPVYPGGEIPGYSGGEIPGYPGGDMPGAGKGIRYMFGLNCVMLAKGDVGGTGGTFVAAAGLDVGGATVGSGEDVWLAGGMSDASLVSPADLSFSPCKWEQDSVTW